MGKQKGKWANEVYFVTDRGVCLGSTFLWGKAVGKGKKREKVSETPPGA